MEVVLNVIQGKFFQRKECAVQKRDNLLNAVFNKAYTINGIKTDDTEIENFLFTLGCYPGEHITVISRVSDNLVVAIKDARYSIDFELAQCISVE